MARHVLLLNQVCTKSSSWLILQTRPGPGKLRQHDVGRLIGICVNAAAQRSPCVWVCIVDHRKIEQQPECRIDSCVSFSSKSAVDIPRRCTRKMNNRTSTSLRATGHVW